MPSPTAGRPRTRTSAPAAWSRELSHKPGPDCGVCDYRATRRRSTEVKDSPVEHPGAYVHALSRLCSGHDARIRVLIKALLATVAIITRRELDICKEGLGRGQLHMSDSSFQSSPSVSTLLYEHANQSAVVFGLLQFIPRSMTQYSIAKHIGLDGYMQMGSSRMLISVL